MSRPNFLFISTHDINPHLGTYAGIWPGAEQARTPNLDRLAAQGVRFDQAFSAAPICAPSRSAVFTGRYPISTGTMHMRSAAVPPADVELFSETLRRSGYYTTNNWFTDVNFDVPPTAFDDCSATAHWRDRPTRETPFFAAFHGMTTHESQIYAPEERLQAALAALSVEDRVRPEDVSLPPYHPDTESFRRAWSAYLNLITVMDMWVGDLLSQLEEDGLAEETIVIFWSDHGAGMPGAKRWASEAGVRVPLIMRWPEHIEPGSVRSEVVELQDLAATVLTMADVQPAAPLEATPLYDREGEVLEARKYAFSARDRMVDDRDTSRTVRDERFRYTRHLHPDRPWMQYSHYPERFATWRNLRELRYQEAQLTGNGEQALLLTPPQRRLVDSHKEPEELFDILHDPHQTENLVGSPEHGAKLAELSAALDQWMERTGDLGQLAEDALVETWGTGEYRPRAEAPRVRCEGGELTAEVSDPSVSIGWSYEPPGRRDPIPLEVILGQRMTFEHPWNLYTGPITLTERTVWVRTWRLGYQPGLPVRLDVPSEAA
ncbi:sulfatase [Pseudoclavibacter sp. RFBB5]|uniref:sulfatase family protein n=1 Tax=Pseudoclavibacter sp. RFBB5 TaxID=2080574 RepID=UPI000CE7AF48|nr:sulfatase [Pseudoclavibacter sp. RFBB5]PPG33489.1 sulfatase [Pseudoclavibacter sp. RFBB5]